MAKGLTLSKKEQFDFRVLEDYRAGKIDREKAAMLLGCCVETVSRKAGRLRVRGLAGLAHGNIGRPPANKVSDALKQECLRLAKDIYYDFNIDHCREMLAKHHMIYVKYTTFHNWCRSVGIGKRKKRRPSKKRMLRERMSNEGLLLQMDGSNHDWFGGTKTTLIGAIDDATSEISYAEFFSSETTFGCMKVLRRIIELKGIPEALYVDQARCFAGLRAQEYTQFARACEELGIRIIAAMSPEAKGRIERAWNTCQDRLKPEFRLAGITEMPAANDYLKDVFLPHYWNTKNAVVPLSETSRYRPVPDWLDLREVFCLKHSRYVRRDHAISYGNEIYKLMSGFVGSLRGKEVTIHEYENGSWSVYYGRHKLEVQLAPKALRRWQKRSA